MSMESTTTIAGLVAANPTAGDPFSQGDDHLRMIKDVLKKTFPGAAAGGFAIPITATEVELNYVHGVTSAIQTQLNTQAQGSVPIGGIIMWSGATAPTNWHICDGTNSTPDLRGKFVIGVNTTYTLAETGGYTDGQILTHTHVATSIPTSTLAVASSTHTHQTGNMVGDHSHQYATITGTGTLAGGTTYGVANTATGTSSGGHYHDIAAGGDHVHALTGSVSVATTNAAPAGAVAVTGRNLPPYYALAYIQRYQ
jgi:hypothetical protein